MIPLTAHVNELKVQQSALEAVAKEVMEERGIEIDYKFGTMIEIPRAALTAGEMAEYAQFFSFRHQRPDPDGIRRLSRRRGGRIPGGLYSERYPAGKSLCFYRP